MKALRRIALTVALFLPACATTDFDSESETSPLGWSPLSQAEIAQGKKSPDFHQHIAPILSHKCLACHSGAQPPLGFNMESRERAFAAGITGPRIVPGNPDASRLIQLTTAHKNSRAMPAVGDRLTKDELQILKTWIKQGAVWPVGNAGKLRIPHDAISVLVR